MNTEKLHNFFAGTSSFEEGIEIKKWMESSDENKKEFFRERELFDALMLVDSNRLKTKHRRISYQNIIKRSLRIAAIAIVALSINYIYESETASNDSTFYNTIYVPAGQRTFITLADGSTVWLNARSSLQYPTTFNKKDRTVILKGEAFFDVEKNEDMPFIVKTEKYDIKVLGTEFNVEAYPDHKEFSTTLISGSVEISETDKPETVLLKPDQKAVYKDGVLSVENIDNMNSTLWKDGLICFKDETFSTIFRKFEQCYGVQIDINNPALSAHKFTGKFRQSDGIDYALRVLQKSVEFNYKKEIDANHISIY